MTSWFGFSDVINDEERRLTSNGQQKRDTDDVIAIQMTSLRHDVTSVSIDLTLGSTEERMRRERRRRWRRRSRPHRVGRHEVRRPWQESSRAWNWHLRPEGVRVAGWVGQSPEVGVLRLLVPTEINFTLKENGFAKLKPVWTWLRLFEPNSLWTSLCQFGLV